MARRGIAFALAAGAAAVALAGCGGSHAPAKAHAVAHLSCDQQYSAWAKRADPAYHALNKAARALDRASAASNVPGTRAGLEQLGAAAARMEATPIPACIDPAGHYAKWMDGLRAAGDNARSQGGEAGLELAVQALPRAERQRSYLNTELTAQGDAGL